MWFKKKFIAFLLNIFDMIAFLVFVWGIVLFVRFFVANPYTVVWASMSPTFEENDFIIVDKITPNLGSRKRWDVIVFVPPGKSIPYIKRVIWLPWETIKIHDNVVSICQNTDEKENCFDLEEKYLTEDTWTDTRCWIKEFKISTWWLFVMWDNRSFSTDSRCCFGLGCYEGTSYEVPFNRIIWKVYIRFFPKFWIF